MVSYIKQFFLLLYRAQKELKKNEPLRLAGATAFFTTFALPPILIILLHLFSIVFRIENLTDRFFQRLAEILGNESSAQIKVTFSGFQSLARNSYITFGGVIFLIFVSTTLFKVIKDSLNQIWSIKPDPRRAFKNKIEKRAASMLIIVIAGILFLTSMVAEGLEAFLGTYLEEMSLETARFINSLINRVISIVVIMLWFVLLFKMLPDAKPTWKATIYGGVFTGILFYIGKAIIHEALSMGNIDRIFGSASAIVLLLLFVFYASFIMYYGACFTRVYADLINDPIRPADHAFKYQIVERNMDEG